MPRRSRKPGLVALAVTAAVVPVAAAVAKPRDRDRDGLPDRWERRHDVRRAAGDPDRDRLRNIIEFELRTDPRRRDSDRDGRPDGREDRDRDGVANAAELVAGTDPLDPDTNGDGVLDGVLPDEDFCEADAPEIAEELDDEVVFELVAIDEELGGLLGDAGEIEEDAVDGCA